MARYPLNLPQQLKQDAESLAQQQGISLNQFILWATAEKVGALNQQLDDSQYPLITYRRGATGVPVPVVRGSGIRVQAIAVARHDWGMEKAELAVEYDLNPAQIDAALAFYDAHQAEINGQINLEAQLTATADG